MTDDDELRRILGDDVFSELSQLENDDLGLRLFVEDDISDEDFEWILSQTFAVVVPVPGEYAMVLANALVHRHQTGCEDCDNEIQAFAAQFIGALWMTIAECCEAKDE